MSLAPGERLGSYEILALIGSGGMGEVYRARDTRLDREVAIKLASEQFSERFEQEARTVAALNHPNICAIYDIGPNYLVMELVEGPTLETRLKGGPLFLEEAHGIARQIADALAAAHEKAIVHRDLKPSNVKIRADGTVKILDFGLAKTGGGIETGPDATTLTLGHTQAGMILGTPGYMSPEQARGKAVDKRADIFAFGAILYEMVTGEKAFRAETVGDALAAVLTKEPDLSKAPVEVRKILQVCLEKDPKLRLHDAGDAMALWGWTGPTPRKPVLPHAKPWVWQAMATAFLLIAVAFAFLYLRKPPEHAPDLIRFESSLPERVAFASPGVLSISPDGRKVVFPAIGADGSRHLWMRALDDAEAKPFEATSAPQARAVIWSPDSRFVAYPDTEERRLKKLDISSGSIENICDLPDDVLGGSWNRDGVILFGSRKGIQRVDASGGEPKALTSLDAARAEVFHSNPVFLPDGRRVLYNRNSSRDGEGGLYSGDLNNPASVNRIASVTAGVRYVPSDEGGDLFFVSNQAELMVQPFDADALKLQGEPFALVQQLGLAPELAAGVFSVSGNGIVVYRRDIPRVLQLTQFDPSGKVLSTAGNFERYSLLTLAPDGAKIVVTQTDPQGRNQDVSVVDVSTGSSNRLTFGTGLNVTPVWSPDSARIAYQSLRKNKWGVYIKAANGSGGEQQVFDQPANLTEWTRDGKYLIYSTGTPSQIWALPLAGEHTPFPVIQNEGANLAGHVSPDGRYIVYMSTETGHREIYVQPFPPGRTQGKWIISRGTLGMPRWRSDGREIYYMAQDGSIMAVPVEPSSVFQAGAPRQLFQTPPVFLRTTANPGTLADVSHDGKRFLIAMPPGGAREQFNVVLNWQSARKK